MAPAPEPTFDTLPPVPVYTYPTAADVVIAQIAVDVENPLTVPLLTIYGDGRVIGVFEDQWLEGTINDVTIQEFFDEADALGFLDEPLVLRGRQPDGHPDLEVELAVDGRRLRHEFDFVRIERPAAPLALLQRVAVQNPFQLAAAYEPQAWVSCTDDGCRIVRDGSVLEDRPVLPHEQPERLLADATGSET